MAAAVIVLFLPAVVLLVAGGSTVWGAVRALRRRTPPRSAAVVRLVAGVGTVLFAVVAISPFWSDMQYGVILLPVMALLGAAVWNAVLLTVAFLLTRHAAGRGARRRP